MVLKKIMLINKAKFLYILLVFFLLIVFNIIEKIQIIKKRKNNKFEKKCYLSFENSNLKIIHTIITRFLYSYHGINDSSKEYILNGIRVMKKYLLPSLENQSCKDFIWIILLGNEANIVYIKSLVNFNNSFQWHVIYEKDIKNFLRNITNSFDILITTRIDYDDRIYYDAVNDVRKEITIKKPIFFHGYNRGLYFSELENKYYDFEYKMNNGAFSVFESLILVLNQVNDIYTIYDFRPHFNVIKKLIKKYKSLGIKQLNYKAGIFDSGAPKFVWVRQKYSYSNSSLIKKFLKINNNFNLNKFYGK